MAEEPIRPPVDIIIPFYKNAALVAPLFQSLEAIGPELNAASCSVVAVNDSPDDAELGPVLRDAVERLSKSVPSRLIENEENLGFVRSVNAAAEAAVSAKHDVILLNSDTVVFPGAVSEMCRVAYLDPMTGFVSPRSNNATICSLPHQPEFRDLPPAEAYANFRDLSKYLPEYHYVPTAVGFCLYIKLEVLEEFGLFDEIYGRGYNEENDLIMRANRTGYRAVLANHAFVYHVGETSFSASSFPKRMLEKRNAELLNKRYPEYAASVASYFGSAQHEAEWMVAALLPDGQGRLDLIFDFSSVGPYHTGTFEAAKRILKCAVETWHSFFNIYVMVSEEARRFHKLDEVNRAFFVPPETGRVFAISFRFGQPFEYQQLLRMSRAGVLNVYGMLDTIAFDCLYLNHPDLPAIWGTVFEHGNGVLYISDFVRDQFRRRFRSSPELKEMVAYLSLDLRDYAEPKDVVVRSGGYILVIGNAFAHKQVSPTVDALNQAFPREKVVALGLNSEDRQNVITYSSGNLSEATMRNLLRHAKFVVYPSLYEGFGIPVLESLAYCKPVLARSIPVMRDIRQRIHAEDNLILYSSTNDLIARLKEGFPRWKVNTGRPNGSESASWEAVTRRIGEFLRGLLDDWSFRNSLLPRLERMRLLDESGGRFGSMQVYRPMAAEHVPQANGAEIEDLNRALRSVSELDLTVRDRDARIADIYGSLSWRVTAPLRKLGGVFVRRFRK
jgi:GT2 family glycosyltransferase/glycosyltransferase involved in cell wall biosynthesis